MRKRSLYGSITAMTIASALTLSAQTTGQTTPRTSGDQRSGSDQTVTVTGCVQQNTATGMSGSGTTGSTGSGSATGGTGSTAGSTGGSTGSTSASGSSQGRSNFVLANAKMAQGSSTSALGSTTRFSLVGMTDAELSKHVNHQVEVTGRLSAMSGSTSGNRSGSASGTTGTGSTGSATGSTGSGSGSTGGTGTTGSGTTGSGSTGSTAGRTGGATGSGMNDMPQLHATNIKMISATCPAQQ